MLDKNGREILKGSVVRLPDGDVGIAYPSRRTNTVTTCTKNFAGEWRRYDVGYRAADLEVL